MKKIRLTDRAPSKNYVVLTGGLENWGIYSIIYRQERRDNMLKNVPIGFHNFKEVIEDNLYYVDKSLVIEELIKNNNKVALFPRPRRFGKSLFISMLDNFFNIEKKEDNKNLFKDLKIYKSEYYRCFGNYPVINLNFKSLKQDNYEVMYGSFKEMVRDIYSSKKYLIEY